jgi:hypothetical protein
MTSNNIFSQSEYATMFANYVHAPEPEYIVPVPVSASNQNALQSLVVTDITLSDTTSVISAPGSYKVLNSWTYAPTTQFGIVISSSDVILDLNGQTLTGAGVNQLPAPNTHQFGISISTGVDGVTIHNGTVTKFTYGIRIGSSPGTVRNINLKDLNLSGQVSFRQIFGFPVFGAFNTFRVAYGSSIIFAAVTVTTNVTIKNVRASNGIGPGTIGGVVTNVIAAGMYTENAKINNMFVENSHFDGHRGSVALGIQTNPSNNTNLNGGVDHYWLNCTFNDNSDLGFDTLFTQNPTIIPGVKGAIGVSYFRPPPGKLWRNVTFVNCEASNNTSITSAGGIDASDIDTLKLDNCKLENNINSGDVYSLSGFNFEFDRIVGGSAFGLTCTETSNITIHNCKATGNQSNGGLIKGMYKYLPAGDPNCPVRACGMNFTKSENVIITNVIASGNKVNRPGALDAKGLGIVFSGFLKNSPVINKIICNNCRACDNNIGFGFSNCTNVALNKVKAKHNDLAGLYLNLLGYPNSNEPLTNDILVSCSQFTKNNTGILSVPSITQVYVCVKSKCNTCNWQGVPNKTC